MQINGANVLVTGANRGLGRQFAQSLLARGAAKVYATARRPELIDVPGVIPLRLDITDPASVAAAAAEATDVQILINNAGISTGANLISGDLAVIRSEMDTHFYGTLNMIRAFAPQLAGGAILNVLSAISWLAYDGAGAYHAAKAAEWALTNAARLELAKQRTLVTGLHLGAADTDMMAWYEGDKTAPDVVVKAALDGIEEDRPEVLADAWSRQVKAWQSEDPSVIYREAAAALTA
ncbi:NAD(P)-dependent dehydrogenase (short-subunit alcohol dehydrogenase family) [Actinoplanes lutulentus]|uniref:NADP-dependent 3-hydroxy acid dehydrogenase YdfG n=1 Tax=Actinoplanes lutulentus TaxID=1287878 RepID=A0A327ZFY4_9ACTN|nr:SDR family oxidoreductase [Actinoplanes lutulentus]MBB2947148.1 NAD(P)-dependent dehydrogenase (short-subunit alcohol dehydrogenase family) [Actinoplanes lutulentus]RAK36424.1 NADP-dependent 3-hydroxy acid dehydrogenase YdfG [Actinoplanes lutulentus]